MKRIGILALQGDFEAHGRTLARLGADPVFVRTAADLDTVDGLVIPGGESTTMLKLLHAENLLAPLAAFGRRRPIFGTCAGAKGGQRRLWPPPPHLRHLRGSHPAGRWRLPSRTGGSRPDGYRRRTQIGRAHV